MTDQLQKGYIYDGKVFLTLNAVDDYKRGPKVKAALGKLIEDEASLEWVYDNREDIVGSFKVGGSRHFLKTEKAQLRKALDATKLLGTMETEDTTIGNLQKDMAFLLENLEQSYATFKWPTQKKIKDDERTILVKETLMSLEAASEEMIDWIISNIEALKVAYDTAKVKREVSQKATDGLNAYRLKKAIEKKEAGGELTEFEENLISAGSEAAA